MVEQQQKFEQLVSDFVRGCGLRREELKWLCPSDFYQRYPRRFVEQNWIHFDTWHGIPAHEVPFLDEYAWTITEVCKGIEPLDLIFPVLPDLDYEALRSDYAGLLFTLRYDSLGATGGPLTLEEVGRQVKHALGLTRMDAQLRAWMQRARRDMGVV